MKAIATIRRLVWLPVLALILAACATVPPPHKEAAPAVALADKARAAAAGGDYAIAARQYLDLAALSSGAVRYDYLLSGAEAFWHGNFIKQAKQTLQSIPTETLTPAQLSRRLTVVAAIALAEHDPRAALDALKTAVRADTPPAIRATIHELRATAYYQLGNYLEAARERIALAPLLGDGEAARRNERALWQSLLSLSDTALQTLRTAPPPDTLSGWLELAYIAKTSLNQPTGLEARITAWRNRYPHHPASEALMTSLLSQQPERLRSRPSRIGLLLPLSGPFANSAAAIRDGFFAAYWERGTRDYQPVIRVYDTSGSLNIARVYEQAVQEGAEFIVGPLKKEAMVALRQSEAITLPTLALNYTDSTEAAPADLFQFGLSPEDEARMVAEHAWLEGHQQALAIIPEGEWGQRTFHAFTDYWQQLGGTVSASITYPAHDDDLSAPLRRLLAIDASENRARALRAVLRRPITFEARRRHDADFIFMLAFPRQARQIPPQLKFQYAGDLPIYATSHIFDGRRDRAKDRDLDGVTFTDIPWLLTPRRFPLRTLTRKLWPDTADQYARLYALGVDAYRLLPYLDTLRASPYGEFPGATGRLVIDKGNRIRRTLLWARFSGGLPRPLTQTAAAAQ